MTDASRVRVIRLLVLGLLILVATSLAQERTPIAEQIAKTYGLDSFSQIEAIRYTFNAKGALNFTQTWIWEPKTGQVSYEGKDRAGKPLKVTYLRSQLDSQPAIVKDEIDPFFLSDQYWLLFPLHLVWDTSAKVEETGMHKLPMGKGSAERVVVTYPSAGGYTPGDAWELFVGTDNRIKQWVYHHGGGAKPSGVWSWDDYKKAGPLLISLNHPGTIWLVPQQDTGLRGIWKALPEGKPLRTFFSNVSVKLVGSNAWVNAQ
ncbi:MAG: hypothetical protein WA188_15775 [Terriglobales bacterium]